MYEFYWGPMLPIVSMLLIAACFVYYRQGGEQRVAWISGAIGLVLVYFAPIVPLVTAAGYLGYVGYKKSLARA